VELVLELIYKFMDVSHTWWITNVPIEAA